MNMAYELGFQAGQAVHNFIYTANVNATMIDFLDYRNMYKSANASLLYLITVPGLYKDWWWKLVAKDPLHVAVETIMLISIVYIMLSRSTEGYKDNSKDKLTRREQEDLLWEWKHNSRAPLAPVIKKSLSTIGENETNTSSSENDNLDDDFQIVVQKQEGKWLTITVPSHWASINSNSNSNSNSNDAIKNSSTTSSLSSSSPMTEQNELERELRVLNFCNFDFLGFQTSDALRQASTDALNKYGCGSCGPRGFYGTIDAHLQIEEEISKFCHTDQAILYSDGASTCSSTIAAFAKRGDVLVVDEGVYEPISTGVFLSRANVHWFRHNDVDDLERVLKELQATDKKLGRKPGAQRRFIVVEGLYKNLGTIAPLREIVALKHKYHYRLILDESFSFGTLGKTGRGALEEHNKRPMYDAEITTIALENSLGSIGGVTVGNEEVVDHQRLSGAGYCYSASAPPFTASAAVASLRLLKSQPELVQRLQANIRYTYKCLDKHKNSITHKAKLVVTSDSRSPIVVLQLERDSVCESAIMSGIMRECLHRGVAIVASTGQDASKSSHLRTELAPCIRITVSALHTKDDTNKMIDTLIDSVILVTSRYSLNLV
jgi:serine palmitoyltransferase